MQREKLELEEQKRKEFTSILMELASEPMPPISNDKIDQGKRSKIYQRLEHLYWNTESENVFRHFYSDIFSTLTTIRNSNEENLDILGANLADIREHYQVINLDKETGKYIDITDSIRKLYDHVNLDIARIRYSEAREREVIGNSLKADVQKVSEELKEQQRTSKQLNKKNGIMEKKIQSQQREYIAILGIFAGVIVAFTAGVSFAGSVLDNIEGVSIYRLVFIILLIAFTLINSMFVLFCYIERLVNGKLPNMKILVFIDLALLLLLSVVFLFWYIGIVEYRNRIF